MQCTSLSIHKANAIHNTPRPSHSQRPAHTRPLHYPPTTAPDATVNQPVSVHCGTPVHVRPRRRLGVPRAAVDHATPRRPLVCPRWRVGRCPALGCGRAAASRAHRGSAVQVRSGDGYVWCARAESAATQDGCTARWMPTERACGSASTWLVCSTRDT